MDVLTIERQYKDFLTALATDQYKMDADIEEDLYRGVFLISGSPHAYSFLMKILQHIREIPLRNELNKQEKLRKIQQTFMVFDRKHEINVTSLIKFAARVS